MTRPGKRQAHRKETILLLLITLTSSLVSTSTAETPAAPALVLDQSNVAPLNLGAAINECCRYVAQTFTAGLTGTLAEIRINVFSSSAFLLHVAIRDVTGGEPGPNILGETTLASGSAPLSLSITFPQTITVVAGIPYAIVVDYVGAPPPGYLQAQGTWGGTTGDLYPGGSIFSGVDGSSWSVNYPQYDLHFQTYVDVVTPTTPTTWGRLKTLYR